ncbi:MAG: O-antigen ligase family protein [bacterium]|nr:O-antigen ligase family protein [bacterium]
MMISEETLVAEPKQRINLFATIVCLTFFALIFHFRANQNDLAVTFTYTFLAIMGLSFIANKLETLILMLLVITASIFDLMEFPTVPIVIGDLHLSDLLIILLLIGRVMKRATMEVVMIPKPLGYPILTMILIALFSFCYTVLSSNIGISRAGLELRIFFYLFLFFIVYYYVRTPRQLNSLLIGIGVLACTLAILQIAQWIMGNEVNILHCRVETVVTAGRKFKNSIFVKFPGMAIILFTLNSLFSIYIFKKIKVKWQILLLAAITLLSLGMIATFARTLWIAVIAAVMLVLFLARERMAVYLRGTLLIASAALIIFFTVQTTAIGTVFNPKAFVDRSVSTFSAFKNFKDDTLFMRFLEYKYAWEKITEHPFLGIGFGNAYRPNIFVGSGYEKSSQGNWVHNGYLAVQMRMGLLGTMAFLWMIIAFFRRFHRSWRKVKNPFYKAIVVGVAVSMVGMLITNLTSSTILYLYWITISAIGMGISEKIYQFEGID